MREADVRIRITRTEAGGRDRFRKYRLSLDGQHVASLKRGEVFEAAVTSGPHTLDLSIDWATSSLEFDAAAGETRRFECMPAGPGRDGLRTAIRNPEAYLMLRECVD